jgi:two-component system sensor histidine kinase UhpB
MGSWRRREFFPIARRAAVREGTRIAMQHMRHAGARLREAALSLQGRLVACMALVLMLSLAIGTAIALHHAGGMVAAELRAARDVAAHALADLPASAQAPAALRQRIAAFDGERHVVVTLLDAGTGAVLARSHPRPPGAAVPGWFRRLVAPPLTVRRLDLPGGGAVLIAADPANELAERWSELGDSLRQLGLFCLLAAIGVLWTTARALRPLGRLAEACARIAAGDYGAAVAPAGPAEVARLLAAFNRMAGRLAAAEAQARRLHQRLLTLQEAERADLARDLHDEVGPLLFAVNLHAASIDRLAGSGSTAGIAAQVQAIQDAVGRLQRQVRALLGQLRPAPPAAAQGLAPAVAALVAFWRSRHRDIVFTTAITLPETALTPPAREAIYRVVQEALTNAVRHARPRRIDIAVTRSADGTIDVRIGDDGAGAAASPQAAPMPPAHGAGFGLAGMRERLAALGGTLTAARAAGGGWTVLARLPAPQAACAP